jgi:Cdc6-like AAA superfamily ATPase
MNNVNKSQGNEQNSLNPFPSTAVARLAKGARELLTIETEALTQIKSQMQDYLKRKDDYGKTICIVGEYGTGKTHLALEILNIIEESEDKTLHPFYLDAPSDNFLELYRKRFLPKLSRSQVLERLDECYSDVVAEELEGDEIYSKISDRLKSRQINAFDVVQKLGLMESKLQRQFQRRLKHITEDPCFSMALTLFQQPEFEPAIWDWFSGKPPGEALKERGITKTINTDALALETIGVLAFLFGQQGHRFILLIDELEKVFSSTGKHFPDAAAMLAFKKLFEAIGKTKALLMLSGLPDFYEALPPDTQQRVSIVIRPSELTGEDVAAYIRKANKKIINKDVLKPFSTDTAKYISIITGGNARKVVRICYHAFQNAIIENKQVTRQIIEEVAQEQFGGQSKEDVHSEILQVIERRGWLFEAEKIFKKGKKQQIADFWLPIGKKSEGIALTLTQDIFSKEDCEQVIGKTTFLKKENAKGIKVASVLVVGGYLAENLINEFNNAFHRVITYSLRHFKNDLDSVLTGLRINIEERTKENDLAIIREKLDQLDRQYRSLSEVIHNELPTKRELLTSIQFGLNVSLGGIQERYLPSKKVSPVFYPVFSLLDELDNIIIRPFYDFSTMRFRKMGIFEIFYMEKGFYSFGQFYLLRDMVYLFHDLIVSPQKFDRILASSIGYDVERACQSFDMKIMSPLLSFAFDKELGFQKIFRNMQKYPRKFGDNTDINPEELDFKINGLDHKLRELAHEVLWQSKDSRYKHETQLPNALGSERFGFIREQIVMSQFPELNDIFIGTLTKLSSIDQMIKEAIVYTVFIMKGKKNLLFESESSIRDLSEFFFMKKMVFLFMDVINRNLNFGFTFPGIYHKELMRFCDMFDHEILRRSMKRGLRLRRIFDIFMESGHERFLGFHPKEMMMYEEELEMQLHRLGKNIFKELEKIHSRYKEMY